MMLSIVIPTFNERENVLFLAQKIDETLYGSPFEYELIFVDDSRDDTPTILERLSHENSRVRFEHRENARGLGTAVVRGFELAQGEVLTVMDADLQHPPELLIAMMERVVQGSDVVVPSRFIPGGGDGGLRPHRKMVSFVARWMGRLALKKLRSSTDPTGGYFMFKKSVINGVKLHPIGWKILIEVLARGDYSNMCEIPYRFQPRHAGESKMSFTEQWNYIRHLMFLVKDSPTDRRFYLFLLVGASGVIVNLVLYSLLVMSGLPVAVSGTLSALCAMCSNFYLNDRLTWADSVKKSVWARSFKYVITSLLGIAINVVALDILYRHFHMHYLLANFIGIAVATAWNYVVNNLWTWRQESVAAVQRNQSLS